MKNWKYLSLIVLVVLGQTDKLQAQSCLKIELEGMLRTGLVNVPQNDGPIYIKTHQQRFTYGCGFTYENRKNSWQLYITRLPYRTDLVYLNMIGGYSSPSTITLYNAIYQRKILYLPRRKMSVYLGGGLSVGHFDYAKITHSGSGTMSSTTYSPTGILLSNVVFFEEYIDQSTTYPQALVLFPMVKLTVEKRLFWHLLFAVNFSYNTRNLLSSTPLETGDYWYIYYQQKRIGTISDYGAGYQIGLSLKYKIALR